MERITPTLLLRFLRSSAFQRCWFALLRASCLSGRFLRDRFQHVRWRGIIAKSLTHVDEQIFVAWRKHKAAAKLQRVFAQAMLLVSRSFCPLACL